MSEAAAPSSEWLRRQRWFGAKGRSIDRIELDEAFVLDEAAPHVLALVTLVLGGSGRERQAYLSIWSGSCTEPFCAESPFFTAFSTSQPSTSCPTTVYCPSRKVAGAKSMKNWLLALSGLWLRAMPTVPFS